MIAVLIGLQAVAGPPLPRELRPPVSRAATPCPVTPPGGEIVVCGRPTDQRLARLPTPPVNAPDAPMTFRLPGGGTGKVHAVQSTLPGATGSGAVVTLRIPFGPGRRAADPAR